MDLVLQLRKIVINLIPKLYKAECGHRTKRVDIMDDNTILRLGRDNDNKFEFCHNCLSKMSVPCAWCGEDINIGDLVTLYSLDVESLDEAKKATFDGSICYDEPTKRFVGCNRRGCNISGADYQGILYPNRHIHRISSPIELCLQSQQAVIVNY